MKRNIKKENNYYEKVRVLQTNLIYLSGLDKKYMDPQVLEQPQLFGQFGTINISNINQLPKDKYPHTFSAHISFQKDYMAALAFLSLHNQKVEGRTLIVNYGQGKYCKSMVNETICNRKDCSYVHKVVDKYVFWPDKFNSQIDQVSISVDILNTNSHSVQNIIRTNLKYRDTVKQQSSLLPDICGQLLKYQKQLGFNVRKIKQNYEDGQSTGNVKVSLQTWSEDEHEHGQCTRPDLNRSSRQNGNTNDGDTNNNTNNNNSNSDSHEQSSTTNYRKDKDDCEFQELQIMINDYLSENNQETDIVEHKKVTGSMDNSYMFLQNINVSQKLDISYQLDKSTKSELFCSEIESKKQLDRIQKIFNPQTSVLEQRLRKKKEKEKQVAKTEQKVKHINLLQIKKLKLSNMEDFNQNPHYFFD